MGRKANEARRWLGCFIFEGAWHFDLEWFYDAIWTLFTAGVQCVQRARVQERARSR